MLPGLNRTGIFIIRINLIGARTVYRQRRVSARSAHQPLGTGWGGVCTVTCSNAGRAAVTEFIASLPYQDTFVSNKHILYTLVFNKYSKWTLFCVCSFCSNWLWNYPILRLALISELSCYILYSSDHNISNIKIIKHLLYKYSEYL